MIISRRQLVMHVCVCLVAIGAAGAFAAAPRLADIVPEETFLYVEVKDVPQLAESWKKTPFFRLWEAPEMAEFLQPVKANLKDGLPNLEKKFGLTTEELKRLLKGRAAFYTADLTMRLSEGEKRPFQDSNIGFIAEIEPGSQERVRQLLEENLFSDLPGDAERSAEDFRGVKIYTTIAWKPMSDQDPADAATPPPGADSHWGLYDYHYQYAFADNLCFILEGRRMYMKQALDNYFSRKEGKKDTASLVNTPNYRQATANLTEPDAMGYVNIQHWVERLKTMPPPPDLDPMWEEYRRQQEKAKAVMGFEEFRSAAFAMRLEPGALGTEFAVLSVPSPKGLAGLLMHDKRTDFSALKLLPDDTVSFGTWLLDLQHGWSLVKAMQNVAGESDPSGENMAANFLKTVETMAKIDIEKDIVGALSGDVTFFSSPAPQTVGADPGEQNPLPSVIMLGASRESGLGENVASLIRAFASMVMMPLKCEPSDFLGFKVYALSMEAGPPGAAPSSSFYYAVGGSQIMFSSDQGKIQDVLRAVQAGGRTPLPARNPSFADLTSLIKPNSVGLACSDVRKMVREFTAALAANPLARMAAREEGVNFSALPPPETVARYFDASISASYLENGLHFSRGRVKYPSEFAQ